MPTVQRDWLGTGAAAGLEGERGLSDLPLRWERGRGHLAERWGEQMGDGSPEV